MKAKTSKLLSVIFILTILSCDEDESFNGCNPESDKINIVEKGSTTKGFFSNECELFDTDDEVFFVIQNEADFRATVNCDQEFPEIDFEKYTLLIGQQKLTWCCTTALKQEVTKNCEEKRYTYILQLYDPEKIGLLSLQGLVNL